MCEYVIKEHFKCWHDEHRFFQDICEDFAKYFPQCQETK